MQQGWGGVGAWVVASQGGGGDGEGWESGGAFVPGGDSALPSVLVIWVGLCRGDVGPFYSGGVKRRGGHAVGGGGWLAVDSPTSPLLCIVLWVPLYRQNIGCCGGARRAVWRQYILVAWCDSFVHGSARHVPLPSVWPCQTFSAIRLSPPARPSPRPRRPPLTKCPPPSTHSARPRRWSKSPPPPPPGCCPRRRPPPPPSGAP